MISMEQASPFFLPFSMIPGFVPSKYSFRTPHERACFAAYISLKNSNTRNLSLFCKICIILMDHSPPFLKYLSAFLSLLLALFCSGDCTNKSDPQEISALKYRIGEPLSPNYVLIAVNTCQIHIWAAVLTHSSCIW